MEDAPLTEVAKAFAQLLGEYREVAGRIVTRYEHTSRFVLTTDHDKLAALNAQVDRIIKNLAQ